MIYIFIHDSYGFVPFKPDPPLINPHPLPPPIFNPVPPFIYNPLIDTGAPILSDSYSASYHKQLKQPKYPGNHPILPSPNPNSYQNNHKYTNRNNPKVEHPVLSGYIPTHNDKDIKNIRSPHHKETINHNTIKENNVFHQTSEFSSGSVRGSNAGDGWRNRWGSGWSRGWGSEYLHHSDGGENSYTSFGTGGSFGGNIGGLSETDFK